uniref:Uncharacterized protein n=1 Tax=Rhizophora mucronata TaxID=61149 RepID=A0A2P2P6L2_RHIMU
MDHFYHVLCCKNFANYVIQIKN